MPTLLRPYYLPPRTEALRLDVTTLGHADSVLFSGTTLTVGSGSLPDAWVISTGPAVDASGHAPDPGVLSGCLFPGHFDATPACLARQDLHVEADYQPGGRYWAIQAAEAALYAVGAGLCVGSCFVGIRRRTDWARVSVRVSVRGGQAAAGTGASQR
ncbi:hypothetical protein [Streptacidiphilus jiangxiensis]|uniref:Uncharacterized protein n=1 Tax=Streptacidiphilus jiangxiensis TaxID=235985 RepID=A0A1H7PMR2_STRJI|nr:hypothetical protein [Streptacidiphilus jiangxiensis]SEL36866.1 hypothetical protein SAMN05414137_10827 [Streptacidiphilus jiangxiensis]